VFSLPNIGPNASKQTFRTALSRVLDVPPPRDETQIIEIREFFPSGALELRLWPGDAGRDPIWAGPPIVGFDDSVERIRAAYQRKKKQARRTTVPVLLAVDGTSPIVDDFAAFDRALIGTRVTVFDRLGQHSHRFDLDGSSVTGRAPEKSRLSQECSLSFECWSPECPIQCCFPTFA